jgi:hypothetical protein
MALRAGTHALEHNQLAKAKKNFALVASLSPDAAAGLAEVALAEGHLDEANVCREHFCVFLSLFVYLLVPRGSVLRRCVTKS